MQIIFDIIKINCMPQFDFSYYVSQITWLLISFGGFFCISKFLILKQLERILFERSNLIGANKDFTQETIDQKCEDCLNNNKQEIDKKIADYIKNLNNNTDKKIEAFKKQLSINENNELLKLKKEIEQLKKDTSEQIILSISEIIEKVYFLKPDVNKIKAYIEKIKS